MITGSKHPTAPSVTEEFVSKTRRKREMQELQALGERLVTLNAEQLGTLDLPERLHDAIVEARRTTAFEARRRQMQYIGRLMREVDPAPIRERLAAFDGTSVADTALLHAAERWRERLIAEETAFEEFAAHYPRADLQRLRQLARNARKEKDAATPPRSYRELFRMVRDIVGKGPSPPPPD